MINLCATCLLLRFHKSDTEEYETKKMYFNVILLNKDKHGSLSSSEIMLEDLELKGYSKHLLE